MTILIDVYQADEKQAMFAAIEDLCSPMDSIGWASTGVYSFWSMPEHEILYIGRAVDLAEVSEPNKLRIVTTNFDLHLSTCARGAYGGHELEEYFAPALPLGDSFSGIVYLHGAVGRDPYRLVLQQATSLART